MDLTHHMTRLIGCLLCDHDGLDLRVERSKLASARVWYWLETKIAQKLGQRDSHGNYIEEPVPTSQHESTWHDGQRQ